MKLKFEENTIHNYMKEIENWNLFKNYIVVVNLKSLEFNEFIEYINDYKKNLKFSKKIQFISYSEVIANEFILEPFFTK